MVKVATQTPIISLFLLILSLETSFIYFTITRGEFRTCHFPLLPDSGCLLSEGLLRNLSSFG